MKTNKVYLTDIQAEKLRTWMSSSDAFTLRQCIASKLAELETELLKVDIWKEQSEVAASQARNLRFRAQRYFNCLEVLDEIASETKLFTVNITLD